MFDFFKKKIKVCNCFEHDKIISCELSLDTDRTSVSDSKVAEIFSICDGCNSKKSLMIFREEIYKVSSTETKGSYFPRLTSEEFFKSINNFLDTFRDKIGYTVIPKMEYLKYSK